MKRLKNASFCFNTAICIALAGGKTNTVGWRVVFEKYNAYISFTPVYHTYVGWLSSESASFLLILSFSPIYGFIPYLRRSTHSDMLHLFMLLFIPYTQ